MKAPKGFLSVRLPRRLDTTLRQTQYTFLKNADAFHAVSTVILPTAGPVLVPLCSVRLLLLGQAV